MCGGRPGVECVSVGGARSILPSHWSRLRHAWVSIRWQRRPETRSYVWRKRTVRTWWEGVEARPGSVRSRRGQAAVRARREERLMGSGAEGGSLAHGARRVPDRRRKEGSRSLEKPANEKEQCFQMQSPRLVGRSGLKMDSDFLVVQRTDPQTKRGFSQSSGSNRTPLFG